MGNDKGFNRGLRVERAQSPGGAKEEFRLGQRSLSSLTGLDLYSRHNPAMNRRAIFGRPYGTWTHATVNTCTPLRLSRVSDLVPKLACASQPWALGRNPFGIQPGVDGHLKKMGAVWN